MKVLFRDDKRGIIKLLVQTIDDLWHLYNLIEEGDLVFAATFRRDEQKTDKLRPERMEKKKIRLGIRVQRVEFHDFTGRLRIHGIIEQGSEEIGSHHTLNVSLKDDVSIVKDWKGQQLKRIEEAVASTHQPLITFVSMDDESALIAQMHQYAIREIATIRGPGSGKQFSKSETREEYFSEILKMLESLERTEVLVLLGPGFTRQDFLEHGKTKSPRIFEKCYSIVTGSAGRVGIQEALKRGLGEQALLDSRVAAETRLVEELLSEISRDGSYAYGEDEVSKAIEMGAVGTLLVTEESIRDERIEELMKRAESTQGKVVIVSSRHEAGEKLDSLGGIAALLRFRIQS
ncbi:MAG: mRNA surveillance protein pelota [Thermoplasmata archaeon]